MPRLVSLLPLLRPLPAPALDAAMDFLDVNVSMGEFVGHCRPTGSRLAGNEPRG